MNHLRLFLLTLISALALSLTGCSKQPKDFVGIWKGGDAGFLSVSLTLDLRKDGTMELFGSSMLANSRFQATWEADDREIRAREIGDEQFHRLATVIARTRDTMELRLTDGTMMSFRRISE